MSIRVTCEKCGVVLKVKEELAGTKGKCPACRGTLNVPTLEQAAQAAPLSATETAAAASAGDTGALKVPMAKPKSAKVAEASPPGDAPPPPPEANGTAFVNPPAAEKPPEKRSASVLPEESAEKPGESATDDLVAPEAGPKPKSSSKGMPLKLPDPPSETDAPVAPEKTPKPVVESKPAASEPPPPKSKDAEPSKSGGGEFDLDSFLMEGPKPKAIPPVPDESAAKKGPAPRAGSGRKLSMSDDETNVSGPSETLPPPNRGRASAAESAMAALTGGSGTASSAKDLLARATQEGRTRAAQMPKDEGERFDFAGAFKQVFREYGYYVVGTIALSAFLYFSMDYMMGSGVELPPLARVYGTVTLKKQPLEGVIVNFTPVGSKDSKDEKKLSKGSPRVATAVTDKDGKFELMYMEGIRGAVVGQNRISVVGQSPEDQKRIPGQYHRPETSGDIREVKETGGEFNIDL